MNNTHKSISILVSGIILFIIVIVISNSYYFYNKEDTEEKCFIKNATLILEGKEECAAKWDKKSCVKYIKNKNGECQSKSSIILKILLFLSVVMIISPLIFLIYNKFKKQGIED
jgi:hypothetical protein